MPRGPAAGPTQEAGTLRHGWRPPLFRRLFSWAQDCPTLPYGRWLSSVVLKQDCVSGSSGLGGGSRADSRHSHGFVGVRAGVRTTRARRQLSGITSQEKGSGRNVFSRGAAASPDLSKSRGNGLLLTQTRVTRRGTGKQKAALTGLTALDPIPGCPQSTVLDGNSVCLSAEHLLPANTCLLMQPAQDGRE